jgi:hypothetical protein
MPKLSLDNTREDYDRPIDYARDRKLLLSLALKQAALSHKERTSAEVSVDLKWAYGFAGHPKLFFAQLITGWNDPDWIAWRAFISTVFCEPFATQEEYDIFYECTQLEEPPEQRPGAVWMPIGRRGGKSRVLAAIAVYLACCYDWSHYLDPGELGVVPVLSADRRQARIIMGYVKAFLEHPRLKDRVAAENAESILLEGNILIEVVTASYKAVRGRTVLTALCLAKGTLIETDQGCRPIENINVGDLVWTRKGLRKVLASGMTHPNAIVHEVKFSDESSLLATADHPIFTCQNGFVPAQCLKAGDEVLSWQSVRIAVSQLTQGQSDVNPALLKSEKQFDDNTSDHQMVYSSLSGADSAGHVQMKRVISQTLMGSFYTVRSICRSMVLSLRQFTSIIETRIQEIIQSTILRPSVQLNTYAGTGPVDLLLGERVTNATKSESEGCGPTDNQEPFLAYSVEKNFNLSGCEQSIVVQTVTEHSISAVYNLKVEGESEYFANGVLVHNCDEIAFWHSDESSANPDKEIIAALEPAMATIPNALLLGASSPYARRGVLWENFDRYFGKLEGPLVWKAPTWVMHPALEREGEFIQGKYDEDPIAAAAEYGAEFRTDVDVVFSREAIEACIMQGVTEVPPQMGVKYYAFVDPSGGSSDSMSLAIGHIDPATKRGVQDLIRERRPPFSPESVVDEFSNTMREYHITRVTGDHYAGEWPRERFKMRGITYDVSKVRKSDIYLSFVPIVNAARCEMIDESRQKYQLLSLERRIARGGHESVDHPRGGHDDCANVVAGVMTVMLEKPKAIKISSSLMQRAAAMPRLPTLENMSGPRW